MSFFVLIQMTGCTHPNMLFLRVSLCSDRKSPLLPGCAQRGGGDIMTSNPMLVTHRAYRTPIAYS